MTRVLLTALIAILATSLAALPASAQDPQELFRAALQSGEAALVDIQSTLEAEDLSVELTQLRLVRAELQRTIALLEQARDAAEDDAVRSRAAGLLDHFGVALQSVEEGLVAPPELVDDLAIAARGEIEEALRELRPEVGLPTEVPSEVTPQPTPGKAVIEAAPREQPGEVTQLPRAGGLPVMSLLPALAAAVGLLLVSGGLLRRRYQQ